MPEINFLGIFYYQCLKICLHARKAAKRFRRPFLKMRFHIFILMIFGYDGLLIENYKVILKISMLERTLGNLKIR
jgi:hypothetical protein